MDHSLPLISTLAIAFSLALLFGYLAERFRLPALVGYLLAGIMAGKSTLGPVADMDIASQLMEVGVILLMFGVGLHFSLDHLMQVRRVAVPGAILQMISATILGALLAHFGWDWSWSTAAAFGLCLSCASTVVMLKALQLNGTLNTIDGQISVGWLVVEDMLCVLILVLLPAVAGIIGAEDSASTAASDEALRVFWLIVVTALRVTAFILVMILGGKRLVPWALGLVARTGSRELFTLSVLAAAICVAYASALVFDVSLALGAFFAGMLTRETRFAGRAVEYSLPLQDVFSVLFFVGVGMLLDWHTLIHEPVPLLATLAIIIFGKSIAVFALVHVLGYPLHTTFNVGCALAQIGEFTFILSAQCVAFGLLPGSVMSLLVAAAILSIALNPLAFASIRTSQRLLVENFAWARRAAMRVDPLSALPEQTPTRFLSGQVIVIGEGGLADLLCEDLRRDDIPLLRVVETSQSAQLLRQDGVAAIQGNPDDPMVLVQAHIASARLLLLLQAEALTAPTVVEVARQLNPDLEIVLCAADEREAEALRGRGLATVVSERRSLADSLLALTRRSLSPDREGAA